MEYEFEQNGSNGTLSLSGGVTIDHAEKLKTALVSALNSSGKVTVDIKKADSIDVACIQLLCSAHHTAGTMGKAFGLSSERSDGIIKSVKEAGYLRHVGCKYDTTKTCIWLNNKWKGTTS